MYEQFEGGTMANRFRSGADWFVQGSIGDLHTLRIGANGERAVDLLHALAAGLPSEFQLAVEAVREKRVWSSLAVPRNEARDVLARLKLLLASYGGVEVALFTGDDQLTLTPELELVIYARTVRWVKRLLAMGLEEREAPPPATWRPSRQALPPAPELFNALAAAAERLGMTAGEAEAKHG